MLLCGHFSPENGASCTKHVKHPTQYGGINSKKFQTNSCFCFATLVKFQCLFRIGNEKDQILGGCGNLVYEQFSLVFKYEGIIGFPTNKMDCFWTNLKSNRMK